MAQVVSFRAASDRNVPLVPYYLTDRETRRHGVDLGAALTTGLMSPVDFHAVLSACRACREGEALRDMGHDRMAPAAPENCANRAILEGLRGFV